MGRSAVNRRLRTALDTDLILLAGRGLSSGEIAHIQMAGSGGRECRCGRRGTHRPLIAHSSPAAARTRPAPPSGWRNRRAAPGEDGTGPASRPGQRSQTHHHLVHLPTRR